MTTNTTMSAMILALPFTSWDDLTSQATSLYGETGRKIAILLRCSGMGSKGLLASQIEKAGYGVNETLAWAGQPYSSVGLARTAAAIVQWLDTQ